ncbi:putative -like family protein [Eutypa lata UCREL1]|uniref:Putative-like family protein n=1 Tax=Eutypa lata (strain UCR-EL1) TaxID=1287681 RepID=M7SCH0_EUTLA|nr:putative -like family protein [Eutypa lata UCREL1]
MVKIAIASATSQLAREVLDKLVETQKHEIIGLDPAKYPSLPGVKWVQTTYQDKSELVRLFQGVETVLCFFPVHLDAGNATQKRLIDAAVEAGVKRFAPSEWATGVKLEASLDVIPWYAGKVEIARYLADLNRDRKVIQYTLFQIGGFMNYLGHPHQTSTHVATLPLQFDFAKQRAVLLEGSLDDVVVWTTVQDVAGAVAGAVEYGGEWPAVGGVAGSRVTVREMLALGEAIGKPFTIEWLKLEEAEADVHNAKDLANAVDLHAASPEQVQAFLGVALKSILIGMHRGAYDVTDEWNRLLPEYEFTRVEDFVKKVWGGK